MDLNDIIALTKAGFTKDDLIKMINTEPVQPGNGTGTGTPTQTPTQTPQGKVSGMRTTLTNPYTPGFNPLPPGNFSGVTPGQVWTGTAPQVNHNLNNNVNTQGDHNLNNNGNTQVANNLNNNGNTQVANSDIISALNSLRDAVQLNNINLSANNVQKQRTMEDVISDIINPPVKNNLKGGM